MSQSHRRKLLKGLLALSFPFDSFPVSPGSLDFMNMKPHPIGRHIMELPDSFSLLDGCEASLFFGLGADAVRVTANLIRVHCSRDTFKQHVDKRVAELAGQRHLELNSSLLISEKSSADGRLRLVRSYSEPELSDFYVDEVFAYLGDALLRLSVLSSNETREAKEQILNQLAGQVYASTAPDTPSHGFAMGPLRIASRHQQEIASFYFNSAQINDTRINVNLNALTPNPPSLLERWDRNSGLLRFISGGPKVLRRGPVTLADMQGQELLTRGRIHDRMVLKFSAESLRDTPSLLKPLIEINLNTEPVGPAESWRPPIWTEEQAVAAWDKITRSLRLRPNSV